jgi:putative tryptophan/tyrosine transport system substrate-binding protein
MKRRAFIQGLSGTAAVAAWPPPVSAQKLQKIPRVGVLWHAGNEQEQAPYFGALRAGLSEFGYIEPHTVILENRFAGGTV